MRLVLAGTRTLRATGNLKAAQKLLGHEDITTTARYAHAMEDDVREAMLATEHRNAKQAKGGLKYDNRKSMIVRKALG